MTSVKIWVKKQLRLDTLTFKQRDMVTIGSAGLLSVFKRLSEAKGPNDSAAKPLARRYALYKKHVGRKPVRDLILTGQLLSGLKLRTVTDNRAYAAPDGRIRMAQSTFFRGKRKKDPDKRTNRKVASANEDREPWLVFSPANRRAVMDKAREVLIRMKNSLVISK